MSQSKQKRREQLEKVVHEVYSGHYGNTRGDFKRRFMADYVPRMEKVLNFELSSRKRAEFERGFWKLVEDWRKDRKLNTGQFLKALVDYSITFRKKELKIQD